MSEAESRTAAADAGRPRHAGRGVLFLAMLAVIVLLASTAAVAMSGWSAAIRRADRQTAKADATQTAAEQATGLQQEMAILRTSLAEAQAHGQTLEAQNGDAKTSLDVASSKAAAAEARAAAAEAAVSAADQVRAGLQARLNAVIASVAGRTPTPQPASNISASTAQSDIAPDLPLAGLPPGATPRDYLVAAQQALREGRGGRAQSALEHAETRMLNQASIAQGQAAQDEARPDVAEVEKALDQLGKGNVQDALRTINGLLGRH